jgi:hypothetical protein
MPKKKVVLLWWLKFGLVIIVHFFLHACSLEASGFTGDVNNICIMK